MKYLRVFFEVGIYDWLEPSFFIKLISESTQLTVLILLLLPWKSCLYLVLSMTEIVEHALKKFSKSSKIDGHTKSDIDLPTNEPQKPFQFFKPKRSFILKRF